MEHSLVNPSQTVDAAHPPRLSAGATVAGLSDASILLRSIGLGVLLVLLSAPTWGDLWNLWWNRYGFSHGVLVPLISGYLVWLQWPTLSQTRAEPAMVPGLLWLVAATVLLLASEIAGVMTIGSLALILLLAGLVLTLFGYAYLRSLAFPLAYLIFMTPVLDVVTEPLEWPFQLLTANMAASMLQAFDIPVLLEDRIHLVLPTVTLQVVRECSGAGLLIAVLAIGLPLASLTLQAWWSRITLVLSSVMIAIVANWVRVTVMGLYAQAGGKDLHGPYHILQGLFVDWVAFGFLFLGAWGLSRMERVAVEPAPQPAARAFGKAMAESRSWNRAYGPACVTLALAAVGLYALELGTTGLKKDLMTFPTVIADWVSDPHRNPQPVAGVLDADASLMRTYRGPGGRRVSLSIAYTRAQRQGKELVGMQTAPLHDKAQATTLRVGSESVSANRATIGTERRASPAVFWYHIDGTGYGDRYQAKLATLKQAVRHGRTDAALVLLSVEPRIDQGTDEWASLEEFAGLVFPILQEYLP
ncbi:MAG: EpsI family protein [Nitrospira sp. CR1.2]|nr:EpsI family protein [Nitrospira sp. CR1.2]